MTNSADARMIVPNETRFIARAYKRPVWTAAPSAILARGGRISSVSAGGGGSTTAAAAPPRNDPTDFDVVEAAAPRRRILLPSNADRVRRRLPGAINASPCRGSSRPSSRHPPSTLGKRIAECFIVIGGVLLCETVRGARCRRQQKGGRSTVD